MKSLIGIESKLNPTNLNDQILRVQTLLARTIPKMIKIELDLGQDLKIIHADSGQIEQVLLVILALNMPGMGGRRCLDRMHEIKPELKTIVTSGATSAANFKPVCHGGNAVFVEKPYQIEDLLRIIRQVLDHHA